MRIKEGTGNDYARTADVNQGCLGKSRYMFGHSDSKAWFHFDFNLKGRVTLWVALKTIDGGQVKGVR